MTFHISRRGLVLAGGAALVLPSWRPAFAQSSQGFTHGVASGEPSQTGVRLWTRYASASPTRLAVEIAEDDSFTSILRTGETEASPRDDNCAHAIVDGLLPGRWYSYRFRAPDGSLSPVGRTRTLPAYGQSDRFRIAVFSCSNITSGWFSAYAHAAARDDIDLAMHLGDYIYESPVSRPDAAPGLAQERNAQPPHETVSLADYRLRYASYRADPDLAELHRRLPMIVMQDDHETANNSWKDGADAHDPETEGPWPARRDAGVRAWREWLPVSDAWYESYAVGDLATLFRLETRLIGRSFQLDDTVNAMLAANDGDLSTQLAAFKAGALADPARTMMGEGQERWLADGLKASVSSGARWQVLAQQVIMGDMLFPNAGAHWFSGAMPADAEAQFAARKRLSDVGLPTSYDKWDGYPAARQRLYASARAAQANLVTLTGDSHNAWAFDLGDADGAVGVEFAGQSVSSHGIERRFPGDPTRIAADYLGASPAMRWMDSSQRGYMILDITRERIETEYVFVPAATRTAIASGSKRITVAHGARKLVV